jgi:hypothetical protein
MKKQGQDKGGRQEGIMRLRNEVHEGYEKIESGILYISTYPGTFS